MLERIVFKKALPKTGDVVEYHFTPDSVGAAARRVSAQTGLPEVTGDEQAFIAHVDQWVDKCADFSVHMNRSR